MTIEYSEFDTKILKQRVAKVRVTGLTPERLQALRKELSESDFEILFIRDDAFQLYQSHRLDWADFELADSKVILNLTHLENFRRVESTDFKAEKLKLPYVNDADFARLKTIVFIIAHKSRFSRCFGKGAAESLYAEWLKNSLSGHAAKLVYIAREKASQLAVGLVSVTISNANADLALVGVSPEFQNRGVLRLITAEVFQELAAYGITSVSVGTQADNRNALRAYNGLGFKFDYSITDFHLKRRK